VETVLNRKVFISLQFGIKVIAVGLKLREGAVVPT
jgi:hypothetical protein